ncbi:MAG TPA: alpha/beta fold hydrolase [Blastocatellia bacterium]|nr:alpha/beta fold hydrolase [Blastocatellia bacterium]
MRYLSLFLLAVSPFLHHPSSEPGKIAKEAFEVNGRERSYYIFVPKQGARPAPMVLLLHGSGMNGRSLVEEWKSLAGKEGLILVGPDSNVASGWSLENDGPQFIQALLETITAKHRIDARRVYLFGYSAGAVYALQLSLLMSEQFAAAAVYAGAMDPASFERIERAKRKIPIALFVSTSDPFFPVPKVRATYIALKERGFPSYMKEVWVDDSAHGHDYRTVARSVNRDCWKFLKKYRAGEGEPQMNTDK